MYQNFSTILHFLKYPISIKMLKKKKNKKNVYLFKRKTIHTHTNTYFSGTLYIKPKYTLCFFFINIYTSYSTQIYYSYRIHNIYTERTTPKNLFNYIILCNTIIFIE